MNPFKPEQGQYVRLIGGFDIDTVFSPNDDFVQNAFALYNQACNNHILSATAAISDNRLEKQAAFDLGVKEAIYSILQLIPSTDPYQSSELSIYPLDDVKEGLMQTRDDLCRKGRV